ncbi:hypothetical protein MMC14_004821 [Varicellaria rhodocarpa]|nr:hypothetical protein [Varicellaria rhodocarpa]
MRLSCLSSFPSIILLLSFVLTNSTLSSPPTSRQHSPLQILPSNDIIPRDHSSPPSSSNTTTTIPYPYPFPNTPSASLEGAGLPGGRRTKPTSPNTRRAMRIAHGTLMGLAFALVLPFGAILLRTLPLVQRTTIKAVHIHAITQLSGYTLAITGMGTGIWLGLNVRYLDYAHTVIGMAVLGAMACQVGLGVWHHALYQHHRRGEHSDSETGTSDTMRNKELDVSTRGGGPWLWVGRGHVWLGRCIVPLGMVNGGLGLELARNTKKGEIGYGVVAGVTGVGYLLVGCGIWWRRRR